MFPSWDLKIDKKYPEEEHFFYMCAATENWVLQKEQWKPEKYGQYQKKKRVFRWVTQKGGLDI